MLEKIINSKARLSILALFFTNLDKEFYAQEVINQTNLDPANVHKELKNLIAADFLSVDKRNDKKFLTINKDNSFFNGLKLLFDEYQKNLNQDKWFLLEEMPPKVNPNVAIGYMYVPSVNSYLKEMGLKSLVRKTLSEFKDKSLKIYFLEKDFTNLAREIFKKLIDNQLWGLKYVKDTDYDCEKYFLASKKVYDTNLKDLTNQELLNLYLKHFNSELRMRNHGWIQNTLEMEEQLLSKYLLKYLKEEFQKNNVDKSVGEVFSLLTSPTKESYAQKEYQNLLKIALQIKKKKELYNLFTKNEDHIISNKVSLDSQISHLLNEHVKNYGWLSYQFEGPGWGLTYFISIIASILRQNLDIEKIIQEEKNKLKILQKTQSDLFLDLKIDKKHKDLFEITKGLVFSKGLRKDSMFYGYYCQDFINKEVARRFHLSVSQVRNIYFWELEGILLEDNVLADELNQRLKYHTCLIGQKDKKILTGSEAEKFMQSINIRKEKINKNSKELLGDTASPGKVRGEVRIVNSREDIKKMKEGNILVSIATSPDLVPAIKKANAIVTDIGGVTCHASIISRELGIPCIVGTKIATKVLKDGDIVDVDATHGRVTIIEKMR